MKNILTLLACILFYTNTVLAEEPKVICKAEFWQGSKQLKVAKATKIKSYPNGKKVEKETFEPIHIPTNDDHPEIEHRFYHFKELPYVVQIVISTDKKLKRGGTIDLSIKDLDKTHISWSYVNGVNFLDPTFNEQGSPQPVVYFSATSLPQNDHQEFFKTKISCYSTDFFDKSIVEKKKQARRHRIRL